MKKYLSIVAVLVLAATLVAGCEGAPSATTLPPGKGMLNVYVTDAPGDMENCSVKINGLEAHKAGGPWELIFEGEEKEFNLIDLAEIQAFLASEVVDAGWYTQLRLHIVDNVLIEFEEDETDYYAKVPSGEIKLVGPFEVVENGITEITLDFDVEKSVHEIGAKNKEYSYIFKPVIKLLVSEPMVLETRGGAAAEWSDENPYTGVYSAKLTIPDPWAAGDYAWMEIPVDIALQDLDTLSFYLYVAQQASNQAWATVTLGIDADEDGTYQPVDIDYFVGGAGLPSGSEDDFLSIDILEPTAWQAWGLVDALSHGCWLGSTGLGVYHADFSAFTSGLPNNNVDETDHVKVVKIFFGGSANFSGEIAYVDDVTINGSP